MAPHKSPGIRRARFISRVVGGLVGFVGGIFYGGYIVTANPGVLAKDSPATQASLLGFAFAGAAFISLAAPLLSVEPYLWLANFLDEAPALEIMGAIVGVLIALAISAFLAILLSGLPVGLGFMVSISVACVLVYVGARAGRRRRQAFAAILTARRGSDELLDAPQPQDGAPIVVDTSALIDGRIVDVVKTGFIQGRLIITTFVLEELQQVADSGDPIKRSRGRRGLVVVDALRASLDVVTEFVDVNFPGTADVDAKLIKLARLRRAAVLTNDYNLNRIASVEGIRVLNLNELVNALKPIATSGEQLRVTVIKQGKEPNQGVGYLEDGTMVVVENGRNRIDETVMVTVTSVLQTAAGRMIFASAPDDTPRSKERGTRARGITS